MAAQDPALSRLDIKALLGILGNEDCDGDQQSKAEDDLLAHDLALRTKIFDLTKKRREAEESSRREWHSRVREEMRAEALEQILDLYMESGHAPLRCEFVLGEKDRCTAFKGHTDPCRCRAVEGARWERFPSDAAPSDLFKKMQPLLDELAAATDGCVAMAKTFDGEGVDTDLFAKVNRLNRAQLAIDLVLKSLRYEAPKTSYWAAMVQK